MGQHRRGEARHKRTKTSRMGKAVALGAMVVSGVAASTGVASAAEAPAAQDSAPAVTHDQKAPLLGNVIVDVPVGFADTGNKQLGNNGPSEKQDDAPVLQFGGNQTPELSDFGFSEFPGGKGGADGADAGQGDGGGSVPQPLPDPAPAPAPEQPSGPGEEFPAPSAPQLSGLVGSAPSLTDNLSGAGLLGAASHAGGGLGQAAGGLPGLV